MKQIVFLFIIPVLFSCCSGNQSSTSSAIATNSDSLTETKVDNYLLEGLYAPSFILSCTDNQKLSIKNENKKLDSLYKALLPNAYKDQTIYVKLKGTLFSKNGIATEFLVDEVIAAEQKNEKNTCLAYDYWCMGNEPFWRVQVSENENLIDFFNPMEAKYYHFTYSKLEDKGKSKVYISENNQDGHKIKVIITTGKCSDGMSEREYAFSSEVILDGVSYKGCAVSFSKNN